MLAGIDGSEAPAPAPAPAPVVLVVLVVVLVVLVVGDGDGDGGDGIGESQDQIERGKLGKQGRFFGGGEENVFALAGPRALYRRVWCWRGCVSDCGCGAAVDWRAGAGGEHLEKVRGAEAGLGSCAWQLLRVRVLARARLVSGLALGRSLTRRMVRGAWERVCGDACARALSKEMLREMWPRLWLLPCLYHVAQRVQGVSLKCCGPVRRLLMVLWWPCA